MTTKDDPKRDAKVVEAQVVVEAQPEKPKPSEKDAVIDEMFK
jgi:hypothetical protein